MCAFQFVNKTAGSGLLSRSERSEKFLIQSHVQSRRRKRQRQLVADGSGSADSSGDENWLKHVSIFRREGSPLASSKASSPGLPWRERYDQDTHANSPSPMDILRVQPSNSGFDPFHCTSVGTDAATHAMLRYIFSYTARVTFLAEAFAPPSAAKNTVAFRHDSMITQRLQRCVDDKMLMYCTLAYGSSCQAWTTGRVDENRLPEYFLGKAIEAVRSHLAVAEPGVDAWLLLSMYALTITELWTAIPDMWRKIPKRYHSWTTETSERGLAAAEMHLVFLRSLVEMNGGMMAMDPYVMESLILADKFLALYRMSRPILRLSWDPGCLSAETRERLGLEVDYFSYRLDKRFLDVELSEPLLYIISDIVEYANIARSAWDSNSLEPKDESWLFLRLHALFYRLLSLKSASTVDECVRITAMLSLLSATRYQGSQVSALGVLAHLKVAIGILQSSAISVTRGLMFWFVCTGAMVGMPCEQRDWFLSKTRLVANTLALTTDIGSWQQHLESYLFLPEQRPQLEAMRSRMEDLVEPENVVDG